MKTNLINLTNEEICEFLLNGKKADALELNPEKGEQNKTDLIERTVFKDKNVEIVFSYLKIADDDIIQQFFIYSNWWGRIKNSFFTCEGFRGKSEIKCGVVSVDELRPFNYVGKDVAINNKNEIATISIIDFSTLVAYCQRKFKKPASYGEVEVISLSPNPWIRAEIIMPDGKSYFSEGVNKKEAANKFAVKYAKELI